MSVAHSIILSTMREKILMGAQREELLKLDVGVLTMNSRLKYIYSSYRLVFVVDMTAGARLLHPTNGLPSFAEALRVVETVVDKLCTGRVPASYSFVSVVRKRQMCSH